MATTLETLLSERKRTEDNIAELEKEHAGKRFPDNVKEQWNKLNGDIEDYDERIELEQRRERLAVVARSAPEHAKDMERVDGFQTARPSRVRDEDIYRLEMVEYDPMDPSKAGDGLKDRAKRAIERMSAPQGRVSREDAQDRCLYLLDNLDTEAGAIARHMLATGSPEYKRGFRKYLGGGYLTYDESRAMEISRAASLTGTAGGFAVPFELDPSIIPTSNLAINPYRSVGRVIPISVDEWRGVSSAGVTAAYAAEATAATDAAPTLAQPTISTEKARAFIPFSIEIGQDWGSFQAEMGGLLADSKDELEATKFTLGYGTNEPFGVITGATTVFTAAGTNTLSVADIYGWSQALGRKVPGTKLVRDEHRGRERDPAVRHWPAAQPCGSTRSRAGSRRTRSRRRARIRRTCSAGPPTRVRRCRGRSRPGS